MKTRTCIILALFLLTSVWASAQTETATLKSVQLQKTQTELVAQIECEGAFTYQTFEMAEPNRLVVEFSPVTKVMTESAYEAAGFGVSTVRTAQYQPQVARVVFDMVGGFPLYKINQTLNRVVVTFWLAEAAVAPAPAPAPVAVQEQAQAAPAVADIKGVTFERVNDQLKVRIHTAGPAALQGFRLAQPSRLLFVFSPVDKISAPPSVEINRSGVKRATIEKQGDRTYQVVFGLDDNQPSFTVDQKPDTVEVLFRQEAKPARTEAAPQAAAAVASADRPFPRVQVGGLFGSYGIDSRDFTDIYGSSGLITGAEIALFPLTTKIVTLGLSGGLRSYSKEGESTYTKDPTTLTLKPSSLSIVAAFSGRDVVPYLAFGLDSVSFKETSEFHEVSDSTSGTHLEAGVYLFPGIDYLSAKIYGRYLKATATVEDIEVKLGGMEFGIGINVCLLRPKR